MQFIVFLTDDHGNRKKKGIKKFSQVGKSYSLICRENTFIPLPNILILRQKNLDSQMYA